jgi:serine/threonine-protein kinase RsbW
MNTITLPNELRSIKEASENILIMLQSKNIQDKDVLFDVKLSLDEAVRNAIVHGNKDKRNSVVRVHYNVDTEKIELMVEDEGAGFDPEKLPDPTQKENLLKEKGRGVYLIKNLMDKVEYSEKGNCVRMIKYLK